MRLFGLFLLVSLLATACVRSSAPNSAETPPANRLPAVKTTDNSPEIDDSEQTYISNAAVVRLLQDWGREGTEKVWFDRVVVEEIAARPGNYVAICDTQYRCWGFACCLKVENGKIAKLWLLDEQGEQSMDSVTSDFLTGPNGPIPVVIAFGQTHMGHGSLYLYEYTNDGPRLLLETPAVDHHFDTDLYRGGKLQPSFDDLNGDNCFDLTLLGIRDTYADGCDGGGPDSSEVIQRVFLFDRNTRTLVEDKKRRVGFRRNEG